MGIKLKDFVFALDGPQVYRPGEVVRGYCVIDLDGQMNLEQLHIKLEGMADCSWSESTKDSDGNSDHRSVGAHDQFLNLKYEPGSVYPTVLSAGQHRIEFNFPLPQILPSSFEGTHGYIRYKLRATIHTPEFTLDKRTEIVFTVKAPTYFTIQELTQGVKNTSTKTVGLFSSKTITLTCHLQRIGHNLGTSVPIICVIENNSKKTLELRASLKQVVDYIAGLDKTTSRKKQSMIMGSPIQPQSTQTESITVPVPPTLDLTLRTCPLMLVNYAIVVTLVIPGFHLDLHCEIPVILTDETLPDQC